MAENVTSVCVTGAGGFIASWLIKLLLSRGYAVHGTVRNPGDEKNAHLWKLENAAEKLKLFKVDLIDFDSILAAVRGCEGVFHIASPATTTAANPEVDIVEPAVVGTLNVLKACSEAKVRRVVLVSSYVAVVVNPSAPKGKVLDEACWSDKEFCRKTNNWYCYSKVAAEAEARDYAETNGVDLVSVLPGIIFGPMLQHTPNASNLILLNFLKGGDEVMDNYLHMIVDVRDVAEAMILAFETPNARGRYLCTSHMIKNEDLVKNLKEIYPDYNYPKSFKEGIEVPLVSSEKLQGLGWKYKPLKQTLVDTIENCKQVGLL
ncbi:cinnamoyl-CoA reductase 1-like [Salvia splendens]|uniref:cinnamoyl-CoA reductase 1-like n=1 Tax=Salvia splendens TaxID=180675 RepID=UPI001C255E5A|nr:cinnamoyl-CoA reductase 1-like [Salvia splendens]